MSGAARSQFDCAVARGSGQLAPDGFDDGYRERLRERQQGPCHEVQSGFFEAVALYLSAI